MENTDTQRPIAKFRGIRQAYDDILRHDPDSVITEYFIRQLCKQGQIAFIESGNKIYVNLDSLYRFLSDEPP